MCHNRGAILPAHGDFACRPDVGSNGEKRARRNVVSKIYLFMPEFSHRALNEGLIWCIFEVHAGLFWFAVRHGSEVITPRPVN